MIPRPHPYFVAAGQRRRREANARLAYILLGLLLGAAIGLNWSADEFVPAGVPAFTAADPDRFPCTVAAISDGDTFRCAEEGEDGRPIRIRLSGVAARESDGSCSPGHPCPSASAEAAAAELRSLAFGRTLSCRETGSTYGRIAAFCARDDGTDLSCAMVASGTAERWERYWGDHRCG